MARPFEVTYVFRAQFRHMSRKNERRFAAIRRRVAQRGLGRPLVADGCHLADALALLEGLAALQDRIAATEPRGE